MPEHAASQRASADILLTSLILAGGTILFGAAAAVVFDLGTDYVLRTGLAFTAAAAAVWWLARRTPGLARFGAANRITLLRVAMVALVAATLSEIPSAALSWTIVVFVTVALFIDGLDGRVARRTGSASAFGARFDMETDAALIMVLSLLCWQFGKAGIWILAAGAMRYVFVLAATTLPWLRTPLPPSRRRQAVCIWQSGLLLGVISPLFPSPASDVLAAATLLLLAWSFAVDIRWLWQQRQAPPLLSSN